MGLCAHVPFVFSCQNNSKNTNSSSVDTTISDTSELNAAREELSRHSCESDVDCATGACTDFHGNRICTKEANPWMHSCDATLEHQSECCSDSECYNGSGACIAVEINHCGGTMPPEENICAYDACLVDTDCGTNQVCAPTNMMGNIKNECIRASCKSDVDCESGQQCNLIWSDSMCPILALSCVSDEATCRKSTDCTAGNFCVIDVNALGGAKCEPLSP